MSVIMAALLIGCLLSGCVKQGLTDGGTSRQGEGSSIDEPQTATLPSELTQTESNTALATEPTTGVSSAVMQVFDSMTLEEKVGQLFFSRCPQYGGVEEVEKYHLGGLVMFAVNFEGKNPQNTREETASYQQSSQIPLLIAVDEEGGSVTRVSCYSAYRDRRFYSPRWIFNNGGVDALAEDTQEKCEFLLDLGINVNLAPDCDISTDESDFMYSRSIGKNAVITSQCIHTMVSAMCRNKVGCSLKHFPGYGNNGDTHTDIITDNRPYGTFAETDFLPFQAGIEAGAGCVMVSHNIVTCMDGEHPASLSPEVHRVLRQDLGFNGVVITDDLSMSAITLYTDGASAAVAALKAGNDMLCCSDIDTQYAAVLNAVNSGEIAEQRIDESVIRILQWKYDLGLL